MVLPEARYGVATSSVFSSSRYNAGYNAGAQEFLSIVSSLVTGELISIITHSMGAAFAKGFIQGLLDQGLDPTLINFELDLAPFQPAEQEANPRVKTYQISYGRFYDPIAGNNRMPGAKQWNSKLDPTRGHGISNFYDDMLGFFASLPSGEYVFDEYGNPVPK